MRQKNLFVSNLILLGLTQYDHVQTNSLEEAAATLPPRPADRMWSAVRPIAWLSGLLLTITPVAVQAQPWAGILSPSRATAWSSPGVAGGIPNRTTSCATLNPGA